MDYIHHFLATIFNDSRKKKKKKRYAKLTFLRYASLEFIETYLKSFEAPGTAVVPTQP